ncbi:hypothetical protein VIGAN_01132400 [Vigna angularis var. angularis]|uniref:At1g61900-like C-terminal domain-containing protein n=2 Tax=Phaseolus angularis TaxID=3914 RepID=A0A0S3QZK9_PHAAN|nr:hypothetical protein VIGAN_01132400 [Vigna angularis var. angularis]
MQVARGCGDGISNKTACCNAMESYVSHLQKQSLIMNLQALDCAKTLAMKLKRSKITADIYGLCHITLKDFFLQVGNQGKVSLMGKEGEGGSLKLYKLII